MSASLVTVFRERYSLRGVLTWLLVLAAVLLVTETPATTLGIAGSFLLLELMGVARTLPGVDERWLTGGFAVLASIASGVWLWLTLAGSVTRSDVLLPALAVAGSLWLLLDARADFVQGQPTEDTSAYDDMTAAEAMLISQHSRLVVESLQNGPKTVSELADACDLTPSRVRDVIEVVGDSGAIYAVDPAAEQSRYALDEGKLGLTGLGRQARSGTSNLLRRFARPFVELF